MTVAAHRVNHYVCLREGVVIAKRLRMPDGSIWKMP